MSLCGTTYLDIAMTLLKISEIVAFVKLSTMEEMFLGMVHQQEGGRRGKRMKKLTKGMRL